METFHNVAYTRFVPIWKCDMTETAENRLKRLKMRAWRRGMKEMDLILGGFADTHLGGLDAGLLDDFELLLNENDQDLFPWFTGLQPMPPRFEPIFKEIRKKFDFQ